MIKSMIEDITKVFMMHIPNKPQRAGMAGISGITADRGIGEQGEAVTAVGREVF